MIKMIKDVVKDKEEFNNPQDLIIAFISGKKPDLMVDKGKRKLDNEFIGKAFFSLLYLLADESQSYEENRVRYCYFNTIKIYV